MQRLFPPKQDQMTEAQRRVAEEIQRTRGGLSGPLGIWLHNPEMARHIAPVGGFLRSEGKLPGRLRELAILVTARFWKSEYEWYSHCKQAVSEGLPQVVVDAIHQGKRPTLDGADAVVFDVATSLHERHEIPEVLYRHAVATLGETLLVELVALLGYYTLVSMGLNAFQVALPPGEPRQFGDD
jgi:4-carboxymuconolactone decarboxylase